MSSEKMGNERARSSIHKKKEKKGTEPSKSESLYLSSRRVSEKETKVLVPNWRKQISREKMSR